MRRTRGSLVFDGAARRTNVDVMCARIRRVTTREDILEAIRGAAAENGGRPLGRERFIERTGITEYALTRHWPRYSEALRDAGFEPNAMNRALNEDDVLRRYVELTRDLGHVPTSNELRHARATDSSFPSPGVFDRFGSKKDRIARALEYCRTVPAFPHVAAILEAAYAAEVASDGGEVPSQAKAPGFVYLVRGHPGEYKIGRTNLVDRRLVELGALAPVEPVLVHEIKTDDPAGIEGYWHRRFADKRLRGEWFRLTAADVAAFKRWRRIF
jgi:hypothetical protein